MPQKRNPVVLEHLRARISRMMAQANGIILQCHNIPFGDTQDIEDEIFPLLFGSLETAADILQLYAVVMDTMQVNVDHLRGRAIAGFTTVTELADTLVRHCELPFRQAHGIVAALVRYAMDHQLAPAELSIEMLRNIAKSEFGLSIELDGETFKQSLDPFAFVEARNLPGGAAPVATKLVVQEQKLSLERDSQWLGGVRDQLTNARKMLDDETRTILATKAHQVSG